MKMVVRLSQVALNTLSFLFFSFPFYNSIAQIKVNPMILQMKNDEEDVHIMNIGDNPEYVSVTLYSITNPGVVPEEEKLVPVGLTYQPSLYSAPFRISLGPRQQKTIKLKSLSKVSSEKIFRLSFSPVYKVNSEENDKSRFIISLGYNVLIRQLPEHQITSWSSQCKNRGIEIKNDGNVRIEFSNFKHNDKELDDFNIYPDSSRLIEGFRLSGQANGKKFNIKC